MKTVWRRWCKLSSLVAWTVVVRMSVRSLRTSSFFTHTSHDVSEAKRSASAYSDPTHKKNKAPHTH